MTDLDTYLQRAAEAEHEADSAVLENVRERHLVAARTWHALADKLRVHLAMRDRLIAEKEAAKPLPLVAAPFGKLFQSHR